MGGGGGGGSGRETSAGSKQSTVHACCGSDEAFWSGCDGGGAHVDPTTASLAVVAGIDVDAVLLLANRCGGSGKEIGSDA